MENEETKWAVVNDYELDLIYDLRDVPRQAFYDRGKVKVINLDTGLQHTLDSNFPCGMGEILYIWIKSTKKVSKRTIYRYKNILEKRGIYTL